MILHNVAYCAFLLIEWCTGADAQAFRYEDLHMVDVFLIPERLEDAVSETKCQDVLDRFFAHVVVDTEDLVFAEDTSQGTIQLLR